MTTYKIVYVYLEEKHRIPTVQTWGFEPQRQGCSGVMCRVIAVDVAADPEQQGQEKGKDRLSGHL